MNTEQNQPFQITNAELLICRALQMVDTIPCGLLEAIDDPFIGDTLYMHVRTYLSTLWITNVHAHNCSSQPEHDSYYKANLETITVAQRLIGQYQRAQNRQESACVFKELVASLDAKYNFLGAQDQLLEQALGNQMQLRRWTDTCLALSLKQTTFIPVQPAPKDPGEAA